MESIGFFPQGDWRTTTMAGPADWCIQACTAGRGGEGDGGPDDGGGASAWTGRWQGARCRAGKRSAWHPRRRWEGDGAATTSRSSGAAGPCPCTQPDGAVWAATGEAACAAAAASRGPGVSASATRSSTRVARRPSTTRTRDRPGGAWETSVQRWDCRQVL